MASKTEILKKSKLREKKINTARHIFGAILFLLIIGGFLFLINCSFLRINKFTVAGVTFEDKNLIGQKAKESLSGSYYYLVPKSSIFFYRPDQVLSFLTKSFPRLADIQINSPELNTLQITVTDKKPKLIWCEGLGLDKKCFYLDDFGRTYSEAPNFSDNIIFELSSDKVNGQIGQNILSQARLKNVTAFLVFLTISLPDLTRDGSSLKILQTKFLPEGDFAVNIGSSGSSTPRFKILFNSDTKADDLASDLSSVLKNDTFLAELKNNKQKLEYLDLRFGRKVFYRFN